MRGMVTQMIGKHADEMAAVDGSRRQLFTRLHDEVSLSTSSQGTWEPLDRLSSHIGVKRIKAKGLWRDHGVERGGIAHCLQVEG